MNISCLPPELLAEIVKHLDWQSRIRCERVSKQFLETCVKMGCVSTRPFVGLPPPRFNISISMGLFYHKPPRWTVVNNAMQIRLHREEFSSENFTQILNGILAKFAPSVAVLEIQDIGLTADTMKLLASYSDLFGKVKLSGCKFVNVPAVEIEKMRDLFIDKFVGRSAYERRGAITMLLDRVGFREGANGNH